MELPLINKHFPKMNKNKLLKVIGSAILISIACLDPGNLLGDIQAAQEMHYKSIWVILLSHILLYFVQEMAVIVSCMSGNDMGNLIRLNYSKNLKIFIWLSSEIAIISADIQEILGAVIAIKLLTGLNFNFGIPLIILIVLFILFLQDYGQKFFEGIFFVLVMILGICSYFNFILSEPKISDLANGFIPNIPKSWQFTAVIGSIIMPQNIFLHSSLVQTRKHLECSKKEFIKIFKIETAIILFISFLINFSLVSIFSSPQYSDKTITLENAGTYLKEFLKSSSSTVWGLGLLASGISSTATGALTGQYLMEGIFKFQFSRTKRILITRSITIIPCYIIIDSVNVDDIMNFLNIVQFIQLPFVIIPLLKFSLSGNIMGNRIYNYNKFIFLCALAIVLQIFNYFSIISSMSELSFFGQFFMWIFLIVYTTFCGYFVFLDIKGKCERVDSDYSSSNSNSKIKIEIENEEEMKEFL